MEQNTAKELWKPFYKQYELDKQAGCYWECAMIAAELLKPKIAKICNIKEEVIFKLQSAEFEDVMQNFLINLAVTEIPCWNPSQNDNFVAYILPKLRHIDTLTHAGTNVSYKVLELSTERFLEDGETSEVNGEEFHTKEFVSVTNTYKDDNGWHSHEVKTNSPEEYIFKKEAEEEKNKLLDIYSYFTKRYNKERAVYFADIYINRFLPAGLSIEEANEKCFKYLEVLGEKPLNFDYLDERLKKVTKDTILKRLCADCELNLNFITKFIERMKAKVPNYKGSFVTIYLMGN